MNGRTDTTNRRTDRRRTGARRALAAVVVVVGIMLAPVSGQQAPAAEQPRLPGQQPPQRSGQEQPPDPATAGRRKVLVPLLEQLQEQAKDVQAALQRRTNGTEQQQALTAELAALNELIEIVQDQLRAPPQVADEQLDGLARRQQELSRRAQELQTRSRRLPDNQASQGAELQRELQGLQEEIGDVAEQLTDLQRRRLRAEYQAALEAREQAVRELSQPGAPSTGFLVEPPQGQEFDGRTGRTQLQIRQLEQTLEERQRMADQQRQQLREYIDAIDRDLLSLQQRQGQTLHAYQQIAVSLEELRNTLQGVQERTQATQEELETGRRQQDEARQQRQEIVQQQQQTSEQYEELRQGLDALRGEVQNLQEQTQAVRQELMQQGEQERAGAQQREQLIEKQRRQFAQQQNALTQRVDQLEEQLKATATRGAAELQSLREQVQQLSTAVTEMQTEFGRVETVSTQTQEAIWSDIRKLQNQVLELREDLVQTRATVNAMLSQTGRSTVGSAGYTWGW